MGLGPFSAQCWGSQLCLEMVLQRTMLRTEFFLEAARKRKYLRGCCCLTHCCFQYATGTLPGSCWCHWLHVRAATGAQPLGGSYAWEAGQSREPDLLQLQTGLCSFLPVQGPREAEVCQDGQCWDLCLAQAGEGSGKGWSLCKASRQGGGKAAQTEV